MTQSHTSSFHLGEFAGQGKTVQEYDRIALSTINPKVRQLDSDLFDLKWFDYRMLHPTEATYYFAHVYRKIFQEAWARDVDHTAAKKVKGFKGKDIFVDGSQKPIAWWKARQAADAMGARYPIFIRSIFNAARDGGWGKGAGQYVRYPTAMQLYGDEAIAVALEGWEHEKAAYIQRVSSPSFYGPQPQWYREAYNAFFLEEARKRGGSKETVEQATALGQFL